MTTTAAVTATIENQAYLVRLSDDLGHQWLADEPEELGGGNLAPTPDRLMLASLGSCTAITMKMVAVRKQIEVDAITVELKLNPAGKPESGNDIERIIRVTGDLNEEQYAQLLRAANACPMHKLLTGEVRIQTSMTPVESN